MCKGSTAGPAGSSIALADHHTPVFSYYLLHWEEQQQKMEISLGGEKYSCGDHYLVSVHFALLHSREGSAAFTFCNWCASHSGKHCKCQIFYTNPTYFVLLFLVLFCFKIYFHLLFKKIIQVKKQSILKKKKHDFIQEYFYFTVLNVVEEN